MAVGGYWGGMMGMADGEVVRVLGEIKGAYPGFVWERELLYEPAGI